MKLLAVLLLAAAPTLYAKVGDSREQCGKRYGDPTEGENSPERTIYLFRGIRITCWFQENKCRSVSYEVRSPGYVVEWAAKDNRFTEGQAKQLLNLNGSSWSLEKKSEFGESFDGLYKSADGMLHAYVANTGVIVESVPWFKEKLRQITTSHLGETISEFDKK